MPGRSYQYQPLEGKSWIRVLNLQPSSSRDNRLECRITHLNRATLANADDVAIAMTASYKNKVERIFNGDRCDEEHRVLYAYEAVSYVWGEAHFTEKLIVLEDQIIRTDYGLTAGNELVDSIIMITPRVDVMLRTFRDPDIVVNLWIDAICLDQKNKIEVAEQVALMGDLYSQSPRTRVWLGPEDKDVAKAFQFLKMASNRDGVRDAYKKAFGIGSHGPIINFLEREWFTRRWVLQEIVLGHNTVLYAHDQTAQFDELRSGFRNLSTYSKSVLSNIVHTQRSRRALSMVNSVGGAMGDSLLKMLYTNHMLGCAAPKDRILALRGVSTMDHLWRAQASSTGSETWMVDMTWKEFYQTISRYYLEHSRLDQPMFLHIAAFGSLADSCTTDPSWCPDWSQHRKPGTDSLDQYWDIDEYEYLTAYHSDKDIGITFDSEKCQLLARQHVLQILHVFPPTSAYDREDCDWEAVFESSLPPSLKRTAPIFIPTLCLVLSTADKAWMAELMDEESLENCDQYMRCHNEDDDCYQISGEAYWGIIDRFFDILPSVLARYTLFITHIYTTSSYKDEQWQFLGVGAYNREAASLPLQSDTLIITDKKPTEIAELGYHVHSAMHAFVRGLTAEEQDLLSVQVSDSQLEGMKGREWEWNSDEAFVGRIGGSVCVGKARYYPEDELPLRDVPKHDMLIV